MKRYKYILVVALACLTISSCQKWLDVQPKTEVKLDKLFESESGFKDALMGVYILMGDASLYGRELSVGLIDVLARQYEVSTQSNLYGTIFTKEYTETSAFENIWNNQYRIVANINAILEEMDNRKEMFHPTNYAIIKGEALGLRAFIHFDLLRMYGWGNIANRPDMKSRLSIPYVKRYHKDLTQQSTVEEVIKLIEADLLEAESLLGAYDPRSPLTRPDGYEEPKTDNFLKNRQSRLNYWGVTATLARLYMWSGNYEDAFTYAAKFTGIGVTQKPYNWIDPNRYIFTSTATEIDFKLLVENIFTLTSNKLYEKLKPVVEKYSENKDFQTITNYDFFSFKSEKLLDKYEVSTGVGASDWRYTMFFKRSEDITLLKFYEQPTGSNNANKVPMITMSEMYYYTAECYWRKGDLKNAIDLINQVRVNRGIDYDKNLPETLSSDDVFEEIVKEWKKESLSLGTMFYFYKRLDMAVPEATLMGDKLFVFPMPYSEVEQGRQDNILR